MKVKPPLHVAVIRIIDLWVKSNLTHAIHVPTRLNERRLSQWPISATFSSASQRRSYQIVNSDTCYVTSVTFPDYSGSPLGFYWVVLINSKHSAVIKTINFERIITACLFFIDFLFVFVLQNASSKIMNMFSKRPETWGAIRDTPNFDMFSEKTTGNTSSSTIHK